MSREPSATPDRGRIHAIGQHLGAHRVELTAVVFIILGVGLRIYTLDSRAGSFAPSDARTIITAQAFGDGSFSLNEYGHYFAGALQYLIITPLSFIWEWSLTPVRITNFVLLCGTSFVLWRAFALTPYKNTMRYVMAALWVWPGTLLVTSVHASALPLTLFLFTCCLACAYYAAHSLRNGSYFLAWSFLCGISVWINLSSMLATVVMGVWILKCAPVLRKKIWSALVCFLAGSLPTLITLSTHGFDPLTRRYVRDAGPITIERAPSRVAEILLGIRTNEGFSLFHMNVLGIVAVGVLIIAAGMGLFSAYRFFSHQQPSDFAFLIRATAFCYIVSGLVVWLMGGTTTIESYVFITIPVLFIFLAPQIRYAGIICVLLIAAALGAVNTHASAVHARSYSTRAAALAHELAKRDLTHVLTHSDFASLVTTYSHGNVAAAAFDGNNFDTSALVTVKNDIQSIVIDATDKEEYSFILCVQAENRTSFDSVETKGFEIYRVPNESRSHLYSSVRACRAEYLDED